MEQHQATVPGDGVASRVRLFGLVIAQCDMSVRTLNALAAFLGTGGNEAAELVRSLDREANRVRVAGITALRGEFATSPLREDVYRAINRVYEITHYAATTIREMEILGAVPDEHLRVIAGHLLRGALSLQAGFAKLARGGTDVTPDVEEARTSERDAEEVYRLALSKLFDPGTFVNALDAWEQRSDTQYLGHTLRRVEQDRHGAAARALGYVVEIFRRREVLRHLSNAADRVLSASDILDETAAEVAGTAG